MRNRLILMLFFVFSVFAHAQDVNKDYEKYFYHYSEKSLKDKFYDLVGISDLAGRSYAVIAGVSQYPNFKEGKNLQAASIDIDKLKIYLRDYEKFDEIIILKDEDMTDENLKYFLQSYLPSQVEKNSRSRFLFAYSGHGHEERGDGYLVQSAARSMTDKANSIDMAVLKLYLDKTVTLSHHALVLINACYSGAFLQRPFGGSLIPARKGALAIVSSSLDELSWGSDKEGSIFFNKFFAGLDGLANEDESSPIVTTTDLHAYLRREVRIAKNGAQNIPPLGDLSKNGSKGEFFFLNREKLVDAGVIKNWSDDIWLDNFGTNPIRIDAPITVKFPDDIESRFYDRPFEGSYHQVDRDLQNLRGPVKEIRVEAYSSEDCECTFYYTFKFDENGRLTDRSVNNFNFDNPIGQDQSLTYDSYGKLIENLRTGFPLMYHEGSMRLHFYNSNLTEWWNSTSVITYEYYDKIVKKHNLTSEFERPGISSSKFEDFIKPLPSGNFSVTIYYQLNEQDNDSIYDEFTINRVGDVIKKYSKGINGTEETTIDYKYDKFENVVLLVEKVVNDGEVWMRTNAKSEIDFDSLDKYGNWTSKLYKDLDSKHDLKISRKITYYE